MAGHWNSAEYKQLKEEFVSGHNGTTVEEIALVVTSAPLCILLRFLICIWLFGHLARISTWWSFAIDFCTQMLPLLFCFTIFGYNVEEAIGTLALVVMGLLLALHLTKEINDTKYGKGLTETPLAEIPMAGKRPFITHFRAYVLIAAAISVLAVDFHVWPRKFCKAETFGTGLMDVGVGSFVVSNGMVSTEARGNIPIPRQRGILGRISSQLTVVGRTIFACVPLIALGVGRLLTVKGVEYQEHVSEYGVHWNFFFTLAIVRIFASITFCIVPTCLSWLVAMVVAVGYQYFLQQTDLKSFVLHGSDGQGSREGFLNANREGIFSCLGYLAVYFASVQIGKYLFKPRTKLKDWVTCMFVLLVLDGIFWLLLRQVELHVEPVSRRMANLPFVLWMMVYNLQILALFLLADIIQVLLIERGWVPGKPVNGHKVVPIKKFCLLEAINRNGLFCFLFMNLSTGIINMSFKTLFMSSTQSMAINILHLFVVSLAVAILHVKDITLRL